MTRRTLLVLVAAAVPTLACSRDEPGLASDVADAGPRLVDKPTWAEHVAPLLYENCTVCHHAGGPTPFSLVTYEDARAQGPAIVAVTAERRMPPFLPEPMDVRFTNERRLHPNEIELLRRWMVDGMPAGDPAAAPPSPKYEGGWSLGEPDLIVEMPESYLVRGGSEEEFRNFVVGTSLGDARWVKAVELRPGNTRVVHHATVRVDSTDSSRMEDARDPAPGWDEMFSVSDARPPGGFFLGWTPGLVPRENPAGMAWRLSPGTDFVIQLHLRPTEEDETVRSRLGVYFTERAPTREPLIMRLGAQAMDIAPGVSDYTVEDSFRLPVDVDAFGIYPHAHYLGTRMEAWAETPDAERIELLRIVDWDFNWQDAYEYEAPIRLPRNSVVHMRFVYDNSRANPQNPSDPPQRVLYGPGSTDEMAELWIQVAPRTPNDLATLDVALQRKQLEDRIEGWTFMAEVDPTDAHGHLGLGNIAQARGDLEEAVRRYRLALASEPDHPQAHYNLGLTLEATGDTAAAVGEYRAAIRAYPAYADAHNNLGIALARTGREGEAEAEFNAAVRADSLHADAQNNLGNMLRARGALEEAVRRYEIAIRIRPEQALAHLNRTLTLIELGRSTEAVDGFRAAVPYLQDNPQAYIAVAWALATDPEAPRRRGADAVQIADAANRITGGSHPIVLDVLAASLAAAGRFEEAVQVSERSLLLARSAENDAWVARIEPHLEGFRARRVWVETER
jgi:tetratricopeptide (TPR) repeat protein